MQPSKTTTAKELFYGEVNALMQDRKCTYHEAFNLATKLYNRIYAAYQKEIAASNSSAPDPYGSIPVLDSKSGEVNHPGHALIKKQQKATEEKKADDRTNFVNEIMERQGVDYHTAFKRGKKRKPELFSE